MIDRYAFDVIGELYFGRMFGFLENNHDHGSYIQSLDTLMPTLCTIAVAPSYVRPLILGSAVISAEVRKALQAVDRIATAARVCVAKRVSEQAATSAEHPRCDLLQQLLDTSAEKGEKLDFGTSEVELEAYVALSVTP